MRAALRSRRDLRTSPRRTGAAIRRARLASAPVRGDQTYRTPTEHHNPMETHGTIAQWDGAPLTLHDSSQWAFGVQRAIARASSASRPAHVRVIVPFVGGAFGSKGQPWSHVPLAAMASKFVGRPVKLLGDAPADVRLGRPSSADRAARRARRPQRRSASCERHARRAQRNERFRRVRRAVRGLQPRSLSRPPNYAMSHAAAAPEHQQADVSARPGRIDGFFRDGVGDGRTRLRARIDPLELRLRNYSERDPDSGKPYTSKHLRECYLRAAERFDWARRNPRAALDAARADCSSVLGMATRLACDASQRRRRPHRKRARRLRRGGVRNYRTGLRFADRLRAAGRGDSRHSVRTRALRVRRYQLACTRRSRRGRRPPAASDRPSSWRRSALRARLEAAGGRFRRAA